MAMASFRQEVTTPDVAQGILPVLVSRKSGPTRVDTIVDPAGTIACATNPRGTVKNIPWA